MNDLVYLIDDEKEIIEQLIEIDNDKMSSNLNYDLFFKEAIKIINNTDKISGNQKILFVTEGDPLISLRILCSIVDVKEEVILFINQGFIGLNKWLIDRYVQLTGNSLHMIDFGKNYNKYIKMNYKVIPIGEDNFRKVVLGDFYE